MESHNSHGVTSAGGAYHKLPPVSTFMEKDAGVQGGVTDELLVALSGGEMARGVQHDNGPARSITLCAPNRGPFHCYQPFLSV